MAPSERKLKIIFWSNTEEKNLSLEFVSHCWKVLDKALNNPFMQELGHLLKIGKIDQPQTLGEEEFDPRIEYTVPISIERERAEHDGRGINVHLLDVLYFLQTFFTERMKRCDNRFTVSIIVYSKEFFDASFMSAQLDVPVKEVAFANIIYRYLPIIHRKVCIPPTEKYLDIMSRYFNFGVDRTMLADFEYDRRQLMIRFPFSDMQFNQNTQQEEPCDAVITLMVRYKSIRRIVVLLRKQVEDEYDLDLYLTLSCPVVIRRVRLHPLEEGKKPQSLVRVHGDRFTSWDKSEKSLLREVNDSPIFKISLTAIRANSYCTLMDRLSAATERKIELRTLGSAYDLPFARYVSFPFADKNCVQEFARFPETERYKLMYMFEALFSRGAIVKDFLLTDKLSRDTFVKLVCDRYQEHEKVVLEAMERLLVEIDERTDIQPPLRIFERIYEQIFRNKEIMDQLYETNAKEGYMRVRKVVITPTRMLFVAPELLMGNRVLRMDPERYPLDKFLRVIFRDDDGSSVHSVNVGDWLIDRFIGGKLRLGIVVAGRSFNYFGSSNSQLRDTGCYFISASLQEINEFRRQLGSFKIQSAPKMMSRLGQCFTQARESAVELAREKYADTYDYKGGADSKGDAYTFSDGVGKISLQMAKMLASDLKLDNCVPSCFQFRFRGYKGILAVDPAMDSLREWGKKYGIVDKSNITKEDCWLDLDIQFRPSQKKFEAKRDNQKLEIVKYSSPVPISLNRPVINILDQVSAIQSKESHERICGRIHFLLDTYLHSLTKSLIDETRARNKLSEFPKLILYEQLTDMNLTTEPFFRSLIRASVRSSLKKLRQKLQIPIPSHQSRAMFGVIDETSQLQYGQVFVRYTKNSFLKLPGPTAERVVLKGPVMITKNPSIVAGDIRMFQAVDLPCLHHLCDVVVFPRWGPRPHTDEMAGSDLDGDEYSVMWDPELFLDRNEEAFDYTSTHKESVTTTEEELNYVRQDSIGRIANAFLINSDLFGINSEVCERIAKKHMDAVDFPKTGVPPETLENKWKGDEPPERPERAPDFMEKNNEPTYISPRLNGQLFRRAKEIDDILYCATNDEETTFVPVDQLISVEGCEEYLVLAAEHYEAYAVNLQSIMDSYGIKSEGELFSGHYTSLRNRISDKDNDDMSFYNTQNAIEQRLFTVFSKFRKQFFETPLRGRVNRYEDVTAIDHRRTNKGGVKDVFRRTCVEPNEEYQKLACAYYKISYDTQTRKFLSFPWLAWDVLNVVRRANACTSTLPEAKYSFDPLSEGLTKHMDEYLARRIPKLNAFVAKLNGKNTKIPTDERAAWAVVSQYCARYQGLDRLLFFTLRWAKDGKIFTGSLNELHVCLLVLQFGLNHLPCESLENVNLWLDPLDITDTDGSFPPVNLEQQHGGIGKKFLQFIEFLASRQFDTMPKLDFNEPDLHYDSVFQQGEWNDLHKIAFTSKFNCLPQTTEQSKRFAADCASLDKVQESEPFIIEIPVEHCEMAVGNEARKNRLCQVTGCKHIVFRRLNTFPGSDTTRVAVSALGSMKAINNLHQLLSVRPDLSLSDKCRLMCKLMAEGVCQKLMDATKEVEESNQGKKKMYPKKAPRRGAESSVNTR